MTPNRSAPAFQEYAANMLASTDYRLSGLAERGLLHTMRCECWVNGRIPADPNKLARYLALAADEVAALLPGVMWVFEVSSCGQWITCPELDAYRLKLDIRQMRMSEGGKAGAEKAKKKREAQAPNKPPMKAPTRVPTGAGHIAPMRGLSTEQPSTRQNSHVLKGEPIDREWLIDYEAASNGH